MSNFNKEELIGQIIDVIEDNLEERNAGIFNDKESNVYGVINLHKEDEDCKGVFYGGSNYDLVANKIEYVLRTWGLIKDSPKLFVKHEGVRWCVSTSSEECFCDEEIWLALGISENKFYELSREFNPYYYFHTFDYGKRVCDTLFDTQGEATSFMNALLKEFNK